MLEGKAMVEDSDMPLKMQIQAMVEDSDMPLKMQIQAMVEDSDMPLKMQIQAMSYASQALDLFDVIDFKSIACHIKKEFDERYGSGWQCVVGSNFGCFFTHSQGTFVYFQLETLKFLIFKGSSSTP